MKQNDTNEILNRIKPLNKPAQADLIGLFNDFYPASIRPHPVMDGWLQIVFKFKNNLGASIVVPFIEDETVFYLQLVQFWRSSDENILEFQPFKNQEDAYEKCGNGNNISAEIAFKNRDELKEKLSEISKIKFRNLRKT